MRMRGANADIAILVVNTDDGVMPQTVRAINQTGQAYFVEIIVRSIDRYSGAKHVILSV